MVEDLVDFEADVAGGAGVVEVVFAEIGDDAEGSVQDGNPQDALVEGDDAVGEEDEEEGREVRLGDVGEDATGVQKRRTSTAGGIWAVGAACTLRTACEPGYSSASPPSRTRRRHSRLDRSHARRPIAGT